MIAKTSFCQLSKPFQILTVQEESEKGMDYLSACTTAERQAIQGGKQRYHRVKVTGLCLNLSLAEPDPHRGRLKRKTGLIPWGRHPLNPLQL